MYLLKFSLNIHVPLVVEESLKLFTSQVVLRIPAALTSKVSSSGLEAMWVT